MFQDEVRELHEKLAKAEAEAGEAEETAAEKATPADDAASDEVIIDL